MNHRNRTQGLSTVALAAVSFTILAWSFKTQLTAPTVWLMAWAGVESLAAFYGLSWSLNRSNRTFFSIFAGGSLLRLVSIGVTAWILTALKLPPTAPLLALVFGYFFLSLVQFPFLTHGLR